MNFVVICFIIIRFFSSCSDPILEKAALNSGEVIQQDLKSQQVAEKLYHPRILLNDSALLVLKNLSNTDITLARYVNDVLATANSVLYAGLPGYNKDDIWYATEITRQNILSLSLAYRWTSDEKYAVAAKRFIMNAVNYPDWTPIPGFLQTAEMTCAVALGYDWLYNWLDQTSRNSIEVAILNFGLNEYFASNISRPWNTKTPYNFGLVTNSSMLVAAVAIGNLYPETLEKTMQIAVANLETPLKSYAPDGAWPEGINYWGFSTFYASYGIETLQLATGTDFGLSKIYGVGNAGYFPIYTLGPNNNRLCFADDASYFKGDEPTKSLFWLGRQFNNQTFINEEHRRLKKYKADPMHVVFYKPGQVETQPRDLDRFFDGSMPIATYRSSWEDTQALFVGAKGGRNIDEHSHLDLGSFELEVLGIRWAADLGRDDYNLPGYFDDWSLNSAKRWSYYRCNSHSHNVPMINNKDQLVAGKAVVLNHAENIAEPYIVFDLTSAYKDDANGVTREVKVINGRKAMQVTDAFNLKAQADIYWGITTPATIQILANGEALLTKSGKTLKAKIVSPAGLNFYSESCYQAPPQNANTGFSRLMVKTNRPAGNTTIQITLTPN